MAGTKALIFAAFIAYLLCIMPFGKAQDTTAAGDTTTSSGMTTTTPAGTTTTGETSGTTKKPTSGGTTSCSDQKTTTRAPKPWEQFFNPANKPPIHWVPLGYLLINKLNNKLRRPGQQQQQQQQKPSHG